MEEIKNIDINALRDKIYKNACEHGWHEEKYDLSHYTMLVVSELSEAVEADRKNRYADVFKFKLTNEPLFSKHSYETFIKDTVEDELADVFIRILDIMGIDPVLKLIDLNEMIRVENCDWDDLHPFTVQAFSIIVAIIQEQNFFLALNLLLSLTKHLKIDILWHIEQKMKYNEKRPYKHGGKKY